jgi:hypothetical protein
MEFTTKENGKVKLIRVYDEGEKFFGKVLVRFGNDKTSMRLTLKEWEKIIVSWAKEQKKN